MSSKKLIKFKKNKLKKLDNIINIIDNVIDQVNIGPNGECHIKFKSDLIFETEGSQIFYTKNGRTAIQAKTLHLNPKTQGMSNKIKKMKIEDLSNQMNIDAIEKQTRIKQEVLENKSYNCCKGDSNDGCGC